MLRRLLLFLFIVGLTFSGFAQTFTVEAEQSLDASKDSLIISVFISADDPFQELGVSNFSFSADTNAVDIRNGRVDPAGSPYHNIAGLYTDLTYSSLAGFNRFQLNVNQILFPSQAANGSAVPQAPARQLVGNIVLPIIDKCAEDSLRWSGGGAIRAWNTDIPENLQVPTFFQLKDSIGGTIVATADGDTLCQGSDVELILDIDGEGDFVVDFTNGTDNFIGVSTDDLDTSLYAITVTLTGLQTFTITQIEDDNGCIETTAANFTDGNVFIDQTVSAAAAGPDQTVCTQPKTATLAGNAPGIGVGVWSQVSGPGTITFGDPAVPGTSADADQGGIYDLEWKIESPIAGATGACPADSDEVNIEYLRLPSTAVAGGPNFDTCVSSFNFTLELFANDPDTGTGQWSLLPVPPAAVVFSDDTLFNSEVTATIEGSYNFQWEISNGICPTSTDIITVRFDQEPSNPNITSTIAPQCGETATLTADPLTNGTSLWTNNIGNVGIASPGSQTTNVTLPFSVTDTAVEYYYSATSTFLVCPQKIDTIEVTRLAQPDTTNTISVFPAVVNCNDVGLVYTLNTNNPTSTYNWTFPTGFTITGGAGTSSVTVNVGDPAFTGDIIVEEVTLLGCTGDIATLNVVPQTCTFTADFTIAPNDTVCIGEVVTLTSTSAGVLGTTTYQWDSTGVGFGNIGGPLAGLDNIQVTFNSIGTKTIQLTIDEGSIPATDFTTLDIVVVAPATATLVANTPSPICKGEAIEFQVDIPGGAGPFTLAIDTIGSSDSIVIENYNDGDPFSITPNNTQTYVLTEVIDKFNCPATITPGSSTIVVNDLPKLTITTPAPGDVCLGDDVAIGFSATGALPYPLVYIDTGAGQEIISITTDPETINITPNAAGSFVYSIDSVVDNNGCVATSAPDITGSAIFDVNDGIDSATFVGDTSLCIGGAGTILSATAFGGTTDYTYWFTGRSDFGPTSSNPYTFLDNPPITSVYTLDSVTDGFNCTVLVNETVTVTVNPTPTATLTKTSPDTICLGENVTLDFAFGGPPSFPITVDLDTNGGSLLFTVNSDTTLILPQNTAGTSTFQITSITDANGCSETSFPPAINVVVNDAPINALFSGGDDICDGESDSLVVTITGGNGPYDIYVDVFGAIPFGGLNATDSFEITTPPVGANIYTLDSVVDSNNCSFAPAAQTTTINVFPTPTAIIAGDATICEGDPTNLTFALAPAGNTFTVTFTDGVNDSTVTGLLNGGIVTVSPDSSVVYTIDSVFDETSGCIALPADLTGSATITVNPTTAPTVEIVQTPDNPICIGDNVDFTVNATDTSATPVWEWRNNGVVVSNTNAYSDNTLADGDVITVELDITLSGGCATPAIVRDTVIMDVQATVTPSVSLIQTPSNPVCSDDTITFDAIVVGGGATPTLAWTLGGLPFGTPNALSQTLTSGYVDGSEVQVTLTSSLGCAIPGGDVATAIINVEGSVTPLVNIIQSPSNPVCAGDTVLFIADNTGGGANPSFIWFVNGGVQTGVTDTFSYFPRNDLDSISVVMNSSSSCATPASATDGHILNIETNVTPNISVVQTPTGSVCPGEDVVFDASISGGGPNPSVQWYVDGALQANTEDFTFFNVTLPGPYTVQGILTSNAGCLLPGANTDTFTTTVTIADPIEPTVSIVQSPANPVCDASPVNFSVNATGQGSNPSYQWFYNTALVSTGPTYNAPSVTNGDDVIVVLTSSNPGSCTSNPVTSDTVEVQTATTIPLTGVIVSDPAGPQYCPGQTVTFSFQGTGQGSNPTYAWTVSGLPGVQGTDSTFTYTLPLTQPAFYAVALTVNSSNSCADPLNLTIPEPVIVPAGGTLPSVDIVQSPGNPVCPGENINFTVNALNEGSNPSYEWFVNGVSQAINPNGVFSGALADGDQVVVELTTTACSGIATATDTVIIQHDTPIIPQVSIDVTPDSTLCLNEFVTFTANATGQGPNPSYTWLVDGVPVSNGTFYTTSFGTTGNRIVELILNRNQACGGPTLDTASMTVTVVTSGSPVVNIVRTPAGPICDGDPVTFEATGTFIGLSPIFTWRRNGIVFGFGQVVSTPIDDLDDIRVDVSYTNPCSGANSTFAELIDIPASAPGAPSVTIVQDPENPICPNELIEFTTIDSLQGNSPSYRWFRNGVLEVADPTFSYFATTDNDEIIVEMTSSASCATPSIARDTIITNFIQTDIDTAIGDTTTFCFGDSVTLSLADTNNVTFEWFSVGGASLGTTQSITIFNSDSVFAVISNGRCSENTDTIIITVDQPYTGSITSSNPGVLCFGDSTILSIPNDTDFTFQWLYGFDSIPGETDTTLNVDYTGSFNLVAQNNTCIDTIGTINVQVKPEIDTTIAILRGDTPFCEDDSVLLGVPSLRGNALGGNFGASFVQTPFQGVLDSASRTLEAWIQTANDTAGGIMGYGNDATGEAFVVRVNNVAETAGQGNNKALKVVVRDGYITGTTNIADNNPHHIAVVFNGDSLNDVSLYVDGQLEIISAINNQRVNTTANTNFRIGTINIGFTPGIRFGGRIDEVRFWDIALDSASINNNRNVPLRGIEPGLVGLWNFEDTTGGTAKDIVAGNDGTLQASARFINNGGFYNPTPSAMYQWENLTTGFVYPMVADTFALWADTTGVYQVTIFDGACQATSDTISIEKIELDPVIAVTDTVVCFGDSVELTASNAAVSDFDSLQWYLGSQILSTDTIFNASVSGQYRVVMYSDVCSDTSDYQFASILKEIDSTLFIYGDTVLCDGDSVLLGAPIYGSAALSLPVNGNGIPAIGAIGDYDFVQQTGTFTIEFWAKSDDNSNSTRIVAGNSSSAAVPGFDIGLFVSGGAARMRLRVFDGTTEFRYRSDVTTDGTNFDDWNHFAASVQDGEVQFYFNGSPIGQLAPIGGPFAANSSSTTGELQIGGPGANYIGSIDELRIWRTALDAFSIAQNYTVPLNDDASLVTIFNFDTDSTLVNGDDIFDNSGTQSGTLTGASIKTTFENPFQPSNELSYQWFKNGTLLSGDTFDVLLVADSGIYRVEIDNSLGCGPVPTRDIEIKQNLISDSIFASPTEFCLGTDSARIWVDLNLTDSAFAEIYDNSNTLLGTLNNPTDTFYVSDSDTVYALIYRFLDGKLCTQETQSVVITAFENPTVGFTEDSLVICFEDSDTLFSSFLRNDTLQGGLTPYSYLWSPADSLASGADTILQPIYVANDSGEVVFQLTVTDANTCTDTDSIRVITYPLVEPDLGPDTVNICYGDTLGLADALVAIEGGKPGTGFSYQWDVDTLFIDASLDTTLNPQIEGLVPGLYTYILEATDTSTGCVGFDTITVFVNDSLSFDQITDTLICFSTDSIQLGGFPTAEGGTGTITYLWDPATDLSSNTVANPFFQNPDSGVYVYTVTATDSLGCFRTSDTVTIEVAPEILVDAGPDVVVCFDDTTTVIGGSPTADGGFGAFVYEWTVLDGSLLADTILDDITLANPTISYTTALPDTVFFLVTVGDSSSILPNRTICDNSDTVRVIFNPEITVDTGTVNFVCFDDTATLDAFAFGGSGDGFNYLWSGDNSLISDINVNDTTLIGSVSGLYNLTLSASDIRYPQCIDSASFVFEVNDTLIVDAGLDSAICFGDTIFLGGLIGTDTTGSGGTPNLTFNWVQTAGTPSGLNNPSSEYPRFIGSIAGIYTYQVTVTDARSCSDTSSINIDVNNAISLNTASPPNVCLNDSISLGTIPVATGGDNTFTYVWTSLNGNNFNDSSLANPTLLPLIEGIDTITLTVTDGRNCVNFRDIAVDVLDTPDVSITPAGFPEICLNDSITLFGSATDTEAGILSFVWDGSIPGDSISVAPNDTTVYLLEVENLSTTCKNQDSVTVVVNPLPVVQFTPLFDLTVSGVDSFSACANGNPTIQATNIGVNNGADTYAWSAIPPSITFSPNPNGPIVSFSANQIDPLGTNLLVSITDQKSCENTDTVFLTQNAFPNATFISTADTICEGDTIELITSGGPDPNPFGPTVVYRYRRFSPQQSPFIYTTTTNGDLTSGFFAPGNIPISPLTIDTATTITYQVEIAENSCASSLFTDVLVNPIPKLVPTPATDSVCFGQDIELVVSNVNPSPQVPINIYNWGHTAINNDSITETIVANDTFFVQAIDSNGCASDTSFDIRVKELPDVTLNNIGPITFCDGDTAQIYVRDSLNAFTYEWKDTSSAAILSTNSLYVANDTGMLFVTVTTDGLACTDSSSIVDVTAFPLPIPNVDTLPFGIDTTRFCFGDTRDLTELSAFPGYEWKEFTLGSLGNNTNTLTIDTSGQYYVVVTDVNGCVDSSAFIEFFQIPLSVDSISGPDTVCANTQAVYTANGPAPANGFWRIEQTLGEIVGVTQTSGIYWITPTAVSSITVNWFGAANAQVLFNPLDDCPIEDTFDVTIIANPVAAITGPTSGCFGDILELSAANLGDSYQWFVDASFGNITPSTGDTVFLNLNQPVTSIQGFDDDSVLLVQQAATSCIDSSYYQIRKYQFASAEWRQPLPPAFDSTRCVNDRDTFSIGTIVPGATYTWLVAGGVPNVLSPNGEIIEVLWNTQGVGSVRSVAVNGDCSDTVFQEFSIQNTPFNTLESSINGVPFTSPNPDRLCITTDSITYQIDSLNVNPGDVLNWTVNGNASATPSSVNNGTSYSLLLDSVGQYELRFTQTSTNLCVLTFQELVLIDAEPTLDTITGDRFVCEGATENYIFAGNYDSMAFTPSTGVTLNGPFINQTQSISWGAGGPGGLIKFVAVEYFNGDCVDFDTLFVQVDEIPVPTIDPAVNATFCLNEDYTLTAIPTDTTSTYQWNLDGNPLPGADSSQIIVTESGVYTFDITTIGGCQASTASGVTMNVLPIPDAEISGDTLLCSGDSLTLSSINFGDSYQWLYQADSGSGISPINNSNAQTYTATVPGFYYVVLINASNNCTDTSDVLSIAPLADAVSLFRFDSINSFCNNDTIALNGNNVGELLSFEWVTNGQGRIVDAFTDTTSYIPSDLDSGLLFFDFIVENQCIVDVSSDTALLRPSPNAEYTPSVLVAELNETVIFTPNTLNAVLYEWVFQPGATGTGPTGLHTYNQAGDYLSFLIATNEFNCSDSFAVPIHVTRNQLIYVPNVFSPNAVDADNRVMRVYGTNISDQGFEIVIYNRWGTEVFRRTELTEMKTNGWDGKSKTGADLPNGVYTYYIKGAFLNGEAFQKVGTVSLIK